MDQSKIWYLEQFDFWKILKQDDVEYLDKTLTKRHFKKGQIINVREYSHIYFLKAGIIKLLFLDNDGNERIKSILGPGSIFGEQNLTHHDDMDDYAVAKEDSIICFMNRDEFNYILDKNDALKVEVIKNFAEQIHKLEKSINDLVFKGSEKRIIEFLQSFRDEFGKQDEDKVVAKNFLNHDEIAKLTSTSRQFVTKTLNKLKKRGCLEYDKNNFYFNGVLD